MLTRFARARDDWCFAWNQTLYGSNGSTVKERAAPAAAGSPHWTAIFMKNRLN